VPATELGGGGGGGGGGAGQIHRFIDSIWFDSDLLTVWSGTQVGFR